MRKLPEQVSGKHQSQRRDRNRIMPLGSNPATCVAGTWAIVWGLIIQDFRHGLRGKNGSARLPGTHKLRCTEWHGDENRASLALHSDQDPVPASVLRNPAL